MGNSLLITTDHKCIILVDTRQEDQRLALGKRGVLLSLLGNNIMAAEVPAELDKFIAGKLRGVKPFYAYESTDASKGQLCLAYNEANNAVFIIGIRDVDVSLAGPQELDPSRTTTIAVPLKGNLESGLTSDHVILVRLETTADVTTTRMICFYLLPAT